MTERIQEALELKPCPFCNTAPAFGRMIEPDQVTIGCNNDGCLVQLCVVSDVESEAVKAWNTRATLQPSGERREAIARILHEAHKPFCDYTYPFEHDMSGRLVYERLADALLASGLVQDEAYTATLEQKLADAVRDNAAIRDDEREKLRNRLDSHLNDFLCGMKEGWDDSVSGFNDAWDVVRKVFDAAAIRSARDGGAET